MKRLLVLLLCLALLPLRAAASTKEECEQAAGAMMEAIVTWSREDGVEFLSDPVEAEPWLETLSGTAELLTSRVGYQIGNGKVTGNKAVVDLSVSAIDVSDAASRLLLQAAGYLAIQTLYGSDPDLDAFLASNLILIIEDLPAITTHTSVYLILGGDGSWKLDLSDGRNTQFLNALSGGGLDRYMESLQDLLDLYG